MAKVMLMTFFLCLLSRSDQTASGAVVYTYRGDEFVFAESPFMSQQFVTGTAIFGSVGDPTAQSLTLSVDGFPDFSITFAGRTQERQVFAWEDAAIVNWEIVLINNLLGQTQAEQISSFDFPGDTVGMDLPDEPTATDPPGAFSLTPGQWTATAVPECSSGLVLVSVGLAWFGARRRRRTACATRLG